MKVPLHFINADIAPGVKLQGGVASHVLNELNITCLPADLPEFIEVDMKDVSVGHSVHVKDLNLPKGVEAVLHRGENPVVATITVPRGTTEAELAGRGSCSHHGRRAGLWCCTGRRRRRAGRQASPRRSKRVCRGLTAAAPSSLRGRAAPHCRPGQSGRRACRYPP
jgi:hypothetical protein